MASTGQFNLSSFAIDVCVYGFSLPLNELFCHNELSFAPGSKRSVEIGTGLPKLDRLGSRVSEPCNGVCNGMFNVKSCFCRPQSESRQRKRHQPE